MNSSLAMVWRENFLLESLFYLSQLLEKLLNIADGGQIKRSAQKWNGSGISGKILLWKNLQVFS